jgi:hypothetical protein
VLYLSSIWSIVDVIATRCRNGLVVLIWFRLFCGSVICILFYTVNLLSIPAITFWILADLLIDTRWSVITFSIFRMIYYLPALVRPYIWLFGTDMREHSKNAVNTCCHRNNKTWNNVIWCTEDIMICCWQYKIKYSLQTHKKDGTKSVLQDHYDSV